MCVASHSPIGARHRRDASSKSRGRVCSERCATTAWSRNDACTDTLPLDALNGAVTMGDGGGLGTAAGTITCAPTESGRVDTSGVCNDISVRTRWLGASKLASRRSAHRKSRMDVMRPSACRGRSGCMCLHSHFLNAFCDSTQRQTSRSYPSNPDFIIHDKLSTTSGSRDI